MAVHACLQITRHPINRLRRKRPRTPGTEIWKKRHGQQQDTSIYSWRHAGDVAQWLGRRSLAGGLSLTYA